VYAGLVPVRRLMWYWFKGMAMAESPQRRLTRVAGVLLVLIGLGFISLVALVLPTVHQAPFMWTWVAVVLLLSVKACFALLLGARILQNDQRPPLRPVEWRVLGAGYCLIAVLLLTGALAGEGWGISLQPPFLEDWRSLGSPWHDRPRVGHDEWRLAPIAPLRPPARPAS
jgi:hypothetical protein